MKDGPTLHLVVERDRIDSVVKDAQRFARRDIEGALSELDARIDTAVSEAYRAGLRDGFAQGCIAASASETA